MGSGKSADTETDVSGSTLQEVADKCFEAMTPGDIREAQIDIEKYRGPVGKVYDITDADTDAEEPAKD